MVRIGISQRMVRTAIQWEEMARSQDGRRSCRRAGRAIPAGLLVENRDRTFPEDLDCSLRRF